MVVSQVSLIMVQFVHDTFHFSRVENVAETDCFIRGFKHLCKHIPEEDFFYPLPREAVEEAVQVS